MKKTDSRYPAFAAALHDYLHGYFSGIGRSGGLSTSPAKVAASRANGCKGGRPRLPSCYDCAHYGTSSCSGQSRLTGRRAGLVFYSCDKFTRRAKPASLKQSRTGRCNPASVGSRPSKRKKSS